MSFYLGSVHRICFWLQFIAATTLLILIFTSNNDDVKWKDYNRNVSKSFMQPSTWKYRCWNADTQKFSASFHCDNKHKIFYSDPPPGINVFKVKFQTAFAALWFSYFSAFCHYIGMLLNASTSSISITQILTAWFPRSIPFKSMKTVNYNNEIALRCVDYVGTAPIMLSLLSILWNANNIVGVILGPAMLALIIIFAFWLSYANINNIVQWRVGKYVALAVLSAVYFTFLGLGVVHSLIKQSQKHQSWRKQISHWRCCR